MTESDDLYTGTVVDRDQADPSQTLTGSDTEDPLDAGYNPPDREDRSWRGDTAEEQLAGETLDQKLAEEVPEFAEADLAAADEEQRAGRLVAPDKGAHEVVDDEIGLDVGRAGSAASAEEAAMHIQPEDDASGAV